MRKMVESSFLLFGTKESLYPKVIGCKDGMIILMSWQVIYAWSKKFHKWVMWAVVVLGTWMMFSGFVMHRELEGDWLPENLDTLFIRDWHNRASQLFLLALLLQMVTGLLMWAVPKLMRRARAKKEGVNEQ